jgi:hypothetical protein
MGNWRSSRDLWRGRNPGYRAFERMLEIASDLFAGPVARLSRRFRVPWLFPKELLR